MTPADVRRKLVTREWVHTSEAASMYGCKSHNLIRMARRAGIIPACRLSDYDAATIGGKPGFYWVASSVLTIRKLARERKAAQNRVNGTSLSRRRKEAVAQKALRLARLKAYYALPKSERTLGKWTTLTPASNA